MTALQAKDYGNLRRLVSGALTGSAEVQNKFVIYQKAWPSTQMAQD
jgi:hypothetical protein